MADYNELKAQLNDLKARVEEIEVRLDLPAKRKEVTKLETESTEAGFWDEQAKAQVTMRRLTGLQEETTFWSEYRQRILDALELLELLELEDDDSSFAELQKDLAELQREMGEREFDLMFSGPYDDRTALLTISAREGGTDSQDWAEMVLRMYSRWAEKKRFKVQLVDLSPGEEAGIKSATLEIDGRNAYGLARSEAGQHRLVRLSPFDGNHRRHTSFALVEVLPEVEDNIEIEVRDEDVRVDTYRATGAGGQHINKTDSAVRMTHLTSGIVVTCQNERSQLQNREMALKMLKARLLEREIERREEEQARLKGEHRTTGWGSQIRSYVLHPYNMVKDHRTGFETSDTTAVLDGEIDGFMEAYLRWNIGRGESSIDTADDDE
ncbi:peptide chain release factor 2 [Candidatus Chlorohelix allophototropha]|uniref:peptide chain release factor 2 n=1 Tax=Candidatus Chlorohelix allophototropha TaxID=3003348 RepID=UPI00311AA56D